VTQGSQSAPAPSQADDILALTQGSRSAPAPSQADDIRQASLPRPNAEAKQPPLPLAIVDAELCSIIAALTGVCVQDAIVETCPWLETQGKLGAARGSHWIGISPTVRKQPRKVLCHEAIHTIQARGGSPKKSTAKATSRRARTVEAEAVEGTQVILSGQPFEVLHSVGSELLFDDGKTSADQPIHSEPTDVAEATPSTIDPELAKEGTDAQGLATFNEALTIIKDRYAGQLNKEQLALLELTKPEELSKHLIFYPSQIDFIAFTQSGMSISKWRALEQKERQTHYESVRKSPDQAYAEFRSIGMSLQQIHIPNTSKKETFGHEILHFLAHNKNKEKKITFHDLNYFNEYGFSLDLEEAITVYFTAKAFSFASGAGSEKKTERENEDALVQDEFCTEKAESTTTSSCLTVSGAATCTETLSLEEWCGEYYYAYVQLQKYITDGTITEADLAEYYFKHGPQKQILDKLKKYPTTKNTEEIPLGENQRFSKKNQESKITPKDPPRKVKTCPTLSSVHHGNLRTSLINYRKYAKLNEKHSDIDEFAKYVVTSLEIEFKIWLETLSGKGETIQKNVITELNSFKELCR
jgi:hypothetical protein